MRKFQEWANTTHNENFGWLFGSKKNPRATGEFSKAYHQILKSVNNDEKAADAKFDELMSSQAGKYQLMKMNNPITPTIDHGDQRYASGWRAKNTSGPDMMR